ncbi:MAG: Ig-like domain-containing protein [Gammaproteobacteria bacterium]|nr:Ig-like domain-containing protein [Gammaproteobacteria bacterium]
MRYLLISRNIAFRFIYLFALLIAGMAGITGSGGGEDITGGGEGTLTGITVTPATVAGGLPVGMTQQYTAIGTYSNGSQQNITSSVIWSSSAITIATINISGLAAGVAEGSSNITASLSGITSTPVVLSVIAVELTKIEITPAILPNDLPLGLSQRFTALGTFSNYRSYDITGNVSWNSSNTSAATINSSGVATSVAAGTTLITASSGVTSNTVNLTVVNNKTAEELIVEPQWVGALPVNRSVQLKTLLRYSDNSTFDITDRVSWLSNTPAVATVSNSVGSKGLVTGLSVGRVTITADDSVTLVANATATIDVTNATIESVSINPGAVSELPAGYSQDFTATGLFSDGFNRPLTNAASWSLSNSNATLEQTGAVARVRGLASGSVTLTYTDRLANGATSGEDDSASITVTNAVLELITINPNIAFSLPVATQRQFSALGTFTGGLLRGITNDVAWDADINTVAVFGDSRGNLTATANGATSVSAGSLNSSDAVKSWLAITVTVTDPDLEFITITPDPGSVAVGETVQFTATATFIGGITADYTERVLWESNSVETATVSTAAGTKGQVTGILAGSVTLTVTVPATATTDTLSINVQ